MIVPVQQEGCCGITLPQGITAWVTAWSNVIECGRWWEAAWSRWQARGGHEAGEAKRITSRGTNREGEDHDGGDVREEYRHPPPP